MLRRCCSIAAFAMLPSVLVACSGDPNVPSGALPPDDLPAGECMDGATQCAGAAAQVCVDGAWTTQATCEFLCVDGACTGACLPAAARSCYDGPAGTMGIGACQAGLQHCGDQGAWGACDGQRLPATGEVCGDGADNDCNGEVDDGCCAPVADVIADGGFELVESNATWTSTSTAFDTSLCSLQSCGNGTGTGPRSGTYFMWFGGTGGGGELGSASQQIVLPATGATYHLTFYTEWFVWDSPDDFLQVRVDNHVVFELRPTDPATGTLGYTQRSVDLSAFADGQPHQLTFYAETCAAANANIFVDDVALIGSCPAP